MTVTVRSPAAAAPATDSVAAMVFSSTRFCETTATPVPANETRAPSLKLAPVTVTVVSAPPPSTAGDTSPTTGPADTEKHPAQVVLPASPGLVMTRSRGPGTAAPAVDRPTLRWLASSTVTDVTATPLAGTVTLTPGAKLAPVTVMVRCAPGPIWFGLTSVTCGPGTTVKQAAQAMLRPSVRLTVTSRAPGSAL